MTFEEYGENGLPVVLLLHKGELNDLESKAELEKLDNTYHLVVPILKSGKDIPCQTEETEISEYIQRRYDGKVFAVCSMTDSWKLARCVLQDNSIHSDKAIMEIGCFPREMIISALEEIAAPVGCLAH